MKRIYPVLVLGIFLFSILLPVYALPANYSLEIETRKFVLDNGLTVLISEMPNSSVVSLYVLIKTGSVNEGKFLGAGISHFLEHMFFKGTEKRKTGVIANEIQSLGGVINATTSLDSTLYTITVPVTAFDQALDILADMLMHPRFDVQDIEKEREVILGEMRLYNDRPERRLSEKVFETDYLQHPYRLPVIGYRKLFLKLKRDDLVEYFHQYYTPNNMILSLAGNISQKDVLPKVKEIFKEFERQPYRLRNVPIEPEQVSTRRFEEEYATDLTRMSLSFPGVNLGNHDLFAMDVLALILGQGESSRLYREVFQKKKLVRSITANNFAPLDRGVFEIECSLDEVNIEKTIATVKEQIDQIRQKGVSLTELKKAKQQMLKQFVLEHQTSADVAYEAASHEALVGDFDFAEKYVQAIQNVSSADVQNIVQKYLVDFRLSIVILKPRHDRPGENITAEIKPITEIKKIVFSNGLTILLREDHSIPLINWNLVMKGGSEQDPEDLHGLCELTARTLVRGTQSRNAETILDAIETRGGALSGFSGKDYWGLSLQLLSGNADFSMDLLTDLIKNPTFPGKEVDDEKEQMKTALMTQKDSIHELSKKTLRELLFQTHPFRNDTLGTEESLDRIRREDVVGFYEKFCTPRHMVLTLFGDFSSAEITDVLKKNLGDMKSKDVSLLFFSELPLDQQREKTINLDKEQAMVMMGFQGVGILSEDYNAMEVLTSLLGSPFSGRIFTQVRDTLGQAYNMGGNFSSSADMGMLTFHVLTSPENTVKVKETLMRVIEELRNTEVRDEELRDIKSYLKGKYQRGIETNAALSFIVALDELEGLGYDHYQHYEEKIDRVSAQDVKRLAEIYLNPQKAAVVVTQPSK